MDYVQVSETHYMDRFLPIDHRRPVEAQRAKAMEVEEGENPCRMLPVYQLILGTTSKRSIPKKVSYLGNFQNAVPPADEFVPRIDANIQLYLWKYFDELIVDTFLRYRQRPLSDK